MKSTSLSVLHIDRAALLARRLGDAAPGVVDPAGVQTNIVPLNLAAGQWDAPSFGRAAEAQGVLVSVLTGSTARLVTHRDLDEESVKQFLVDL